MSDNNPTTAQDHADAIYPEGQSAAGPYHSINQDAIQAAEAMDSLSNIVDGYTMEREDIELISIVGKHLRTLVDNFDCTADRAELRQRVEKAEGAIRALK